MKQKRKAQFQMPLEVRWPGMHGTAICSNGTFLFDGRTLRLSAHVHAVEDTSGGRKELSPPTSPAMASGLGPGTEELIGRVRRLGQKLMDLEHAGMEKRREQVAVSVPPRRSLVAFGRFGATTDAPSAAKPCRARSSQLNSDAPKGLLFGAFTSSQRHRDSLL